MASRRWAQMIPYLASHLDIYVFTMNCKGDLQIPLDDTRIFRVGQLPNATFLQSKKKKLSIRQRILSYLRRDLRTIDSTFFTFYYANKHTFDQVLNEVQPKYLITSLGPFSSAFFGSRAKKRIKNIKWIVDLRDPMGTYTNIKRSNIRLKVDTMIDRLVVSKSDLIFTTSKLYADELSKIYKKEVHIVYNGFKDVLERTRNSSGITSDIDYSQSIYYAGQIYKYREPGFQVLLNALNDMGSSGKKFVIRLLGTYERAQEITRLVSMYPNVDVKILRPGSEAAVTEEMSKAGILLIIEDIDYANPMSGTVPGKLFEYLPQKGKILSIAREDSEIKEILMRTNRGECHKTKNKIIEFLSNNEPFDLPNQKEIAFFSRENQANKFLELIRNLESNSDS